MSGTWKLQDAKNKFSEVIAQAIKQGPQLITRRGEKAAVVMSYAEYEKLCKSQGKLSEFFRNSPLAGIDLARDKSLLRDETGLGNTWSTPASFQSCHSKQPFAWVVEWVDSFDPDDVYFSALTIDEIIKGIEKLPKSRRKTEQHTGLKEDLLARFQGKIILVDTDVIVECGILTAHAESTGKPMPAIDALIAATAKVNQLTLVTRNVSDFDAAGLKVLNPWD